MTLLVAAVLIVVAYYLYKRKRRKSAHEATRETTPALDAWLREVLELELAEGALGLRQSSVHERRPLARTLAHEPDPEVVAKIEEKVRTVEIEYLRYAHETDVETTVRVRYEDGSVGARTRRLAFGDVPDGVRADFQKNGSTRVFRTWAFPWQRAHAL